MNNENKINITSLRTLMSKLTEHFHDVSDLISGQIKAVVHQNFDELNQLIEEQVTINTTINELEKEFKEELVRSFSALEAQPKEYSVSNLIKHVDESADLLTDLRDQLRHAVQSAQQHQQHLVQLLEFAQDHIAQTIRDIFAIADKHGTRYKASGQKSSGSGQSRMINQTI